MSNLTPEETESRKKAIFDSMSPRRQKHIIKKGYAKWDPFEEPKDPIDIRKDKTKRTTQQLVREFLLSRTFDEYSNAYGRGVLDICHGIINHDERFQGMYDFAIWYRALLAKEGYEDNLRSD
ncbi:MAG: hypothetical protein DRH32_01560 [Deltaproteobacteria bacterium]|nr:MAG: hypothetical protein DRH32_01560 [Deltaproteobacteria bacterium]